MERNPGLLLGAALGTLARAGRDKVTVICSPGRRDFGAWLEQLVAESTGKEGKGLIPVDREPLGPPANYGEDRVFVYVRTDRGADPTQDRFVDSFEAAGSPVIRIPVADAYQLGAEFFRWEMATAVAGSIISINPFDQPDVEAAKIATRRLTTAFEERGALPSESPSAEESGVQIFGAKPGANLEQSLRTLLAGLRGGQYLMGQHRSAGYIALLAFIEMDPQYEATLNSIRERIRDATRAATCLGFGPRYLHSTGQAYKGGPPNGTFIEITADDPADVPVPGQKYTFGIVKAAQAQGDLEVLRDRGHRTLRVHLGANIRGGLAQLAAAVNRALQ
jgi:transaldolase/glucose-6-phosphate isomerase